MRKLIDSLRSFFRPAKPRAPAPMDNWASLAADICPDCKVHPVKLYEGASGGMSTNVYCANCGHGYNITTALQLAEDIGVNLYFADDGPEKARRALDARCNPDTKVRS